MATPLDPFIEAFAEDPVAGLMLVGMVFALSYGGELLFARMIIGPYVARRARRENLKAVEDGEWDPAIQRATAGIRGEVKEIRALVEGKEIEAKIEQVETRLEELDQALEARLANISIEPVQAKIEELDQALGVHLNALHEGLQTLPARLRSSLEGKHGAEIKQLYKEATEAEGEIVEEYEAGLSPSDRALAKFDGLTETEGFQKYEGAHPIGGTIVRAVKELIKGEIDTRRGIVQMRQTGTSRKFPDVYGGR